MPALQPGPELFAALDAKLAMQRESMTTCEYLVKAIEVIDLQLGRGYASEHPQLIAAFMETCAIEAVAGTLEREISHLTETIAQAIRASA